MNAAHVLRMVQAYTVDYGLWLPVDGIDEEWTNGQWWDYVVEASDNISSNFEKKRVLEMLINNNDLNAFQALIILDSIEDMSSNYEKSNLMIAMGPDLPEDGEVKAAFMRVAKSITSDHDYGKVMRSVNF